MQFTRTILICVAELYPGGVYLRGSIGGRVDFPTE